MVTADDNELDAFWEIAREHANLGGVPVFSGPDPVRTLRPPAWAFGATPEQADELLGLVLDGTKTATASSHADYVAEGESLPAPGMLGIVLDGAGHPRALVVTTETRVTRASSTGGCPTNASSPSTPTVVSHRTCRSSSNASASSTPRPDHAWRRRATAHRSSQDHVCHVDRLMNVGDEPRCIICQRARRWPAWLGTIRSTTNGLCLRNYPHGPTCGATNVSGGSTASRSLESRQRSLSRRSSWRHSERGWRPPTRLAGWRLLSPYSAPSSSRSLSCRGPCASRTFGIAEISREPTTAQLDRRASLDVQKRYPDESLRLESWRFAGRCTSSGAPARGWTAI